MFKAEAIVEVVEPDDDHDADSCSAGFACAEFAEKTECQTACGRSGRGEKCQWVR